MIGDTGRRMTVYVYLHENNGSGRPGGQVATLTKNGINFAGPTEGLNKYRVWKARCYPQPPHGGGCLNDASSVHLKPDTQYWVYVWSGKSQNGADLRSTAHGQNGATGWTIADSVLTKPSYGSSSSGYNWTVDSFPISFKVEGTTNPEVNVSISDVTVTEGTHATADFVVSLDRATGGPVTFDYETVAGTASDAGDGDFFADDGTLTIQPGETQKTISIAVDDDAVAESDETFEMRLSNLRGANAFADDTGTATIVNAVPLAVSINDASAVEGVDETIDFTVELNRRTTRPVTINVLFSSGSADFSDITEPDPTSVTFQPGETRKTYSLGIVDDGMNEPSESFTVILQYPGRTVDINVGSPGTGTITNTETLEASFENMPASHDGSRFSFNLAFTAEVGSACGTCATGPSRWSTGR